MRKNCSSVRKKNEKKGFGLGKKKFGSDTDTEIGPWFRFPIPKPNFGLTLLGSLGHFKGSTKKKWL